ncbi:MAG: hypothetical protein ACKOXK_00635 [Chakrabartia sp.]
MMPLLPAHYAVSEALVALASAWGMAKLMPKNRLGALALLPFGLAGLLGVIRISAGPNGLIVPCHQFMSRSGAIFGLVCLLGGLSPQRDSRWIVAGLFVAASATALPAIGMPLFGLVMLAIGVQAYRLSPIDRPVFAVAGLALLPIAQLVAAPLRSSFPDIAWHLFHVLVAIWLISTAAVLNFEGHSKRA